MKRLYVLYDARCVLCRRIRDWIRGQRAYCEIVLLPSSGVEARQRFPGLQPEDLNVIADDGRLWKGNHAWIVVLFAMRRYRTLARRLANPLLLPLARQAFAAVSEHRSSLGWWLGIRDDGQLARQLTAVRDPGCRL